MFDLYTITTPDARVMVDKIRKEAITNDTPISVAVVDTHGHPLIQERLLGASLATYEAALNKAQTAMFFQKDTVKFSHQSGTAMGSWMLNPVPDLAGLDNRRTCFPQFVSWAGGVRICDPDYPHRNAYGAVGISGLEQLKDDELARIGINAWLESSPITT